MRKLAGLMMLVLWSTGTMAQSDNCASATALSECTVTSSANTGATVGGDDTYLPADICGTGIERSVWYSFTPTQTGAYTLGIFNFACSGSTLLETGIFTGNCGSLLPVTCISGTAGYTKSFLATAGTVYYIVVDGTAGSDCTFDINVCTGCDAEAGFVVDVSEGAYPLNVNFTNTGPGGNVYTWDFGAGGATFDGTHASFTYDEPGTFIVTLSAFNGVCYNSHTDTIFVTGSSSLIIPNIFTPNGDEQNDLFSIRCLGIKSLDVQIYNRWGELVGGWQGTKGSWDGYSVVAGVKAAEGSYFYRIKAEGFDGNQFDEKGSLLLLR